MSYAFWNCSYLNCSANSFVRVECLSDLWSTHIWMDSFGNKNGWEWIKNQKLISTFNLIITTLLLTSLLKWHSLKHITGATPCATQLCYILPLMPGTWSSDSCLGHRCCLRERFGRILHSWVTVYWTIALENLLPSNLCVFYYLKIRL